MQIRSQVFLHSCLVFCLICKHVHFSIKLCVKEMRIFILVTGNRDFQAFFSFLQYSDARHLHASLFYTHLSVFFDEYVEFSVSGLAVRREWWSIGIVWCFILIMETWAGRGSRPESRSFCAVICRAIKMLKSAHLTSEWCTFINVIYRVMHTCYPACLSRPCVLNAVSFSCSGRPLVMRVVLLRLASDSPRCTLIKRGTSARDFCILCILQGLINTDSWCPLSDLSDCCSRIF